MAKKEERSEDLNPRSKDLDEKIRQLLDPSVPDEPTPDTKSDTPEIKEVSGSKPIDTTAPEVESSTAPVLSAPSKKGRKVIVPVEHQEPELPVPTPEPKKKKPVKIAVSHSDDTKEEIAEKLDEAIASLNEAEPPAEEKPEVETEEGDQGSVEATVEDEDDDEKEYNEDDEKTDTPDAPEVAGTEESNEEEDKKPLPKPAVIEDAATDKAVKEIVAAEGDELLQVEDALRDSDEEVAKPARKHFSLKKIFLNKKALKLYLIILIISLVAAALYPTTRYGALNLAGVRSSSSLTVLDSTSQQPLKNVTVSIGSVAVKTDSSGVAKLDKVKLGKASLKIERIAFAPLEKTITVGLGSNPLGSFNITPTGSQYKLEITDLLSGKPINGVEVETSDATAKSDEKGVVLLTLPKTDEAEVTVTIKASYYRTETIKLKLASKETIKFQLTPARKHVFISKRTGKFDVYNIYADGKEEKLLLAGSGNEKEDLTLLPHPTKELVAYVSSRAGKKSPEGFALNDLVLLDANTGRTTPVASAERLQLVGWAGDRLVFVAITSGPSAATAQRNRLLSYNLEDGGKTVELATSNYFNDLLMARGVVYFAPSSAIDGGTPAQFYQINPDGSNQKSLFNQEVWSILRTSYDHFSLSVGQQWYDYALGATQPKKQDIAPTTKTGRVYLDSPDGKKSVWVDQRDGKGTLIVYDIAGNKDTVLTARTGLGLPTVWLDNNTVVFRVDSKDEVADYVISLQGGEARKIRDVTKTGGLDNWYYY